MKIKTIASIALSSLLLIGCGAEDTSSTKTGKEPSSVDDRALAQKIIFNKSYKDTVSDEDYVDWFVMETAKAGHTYYLHLQNKGDRNDNYTYTYVPYFILDDEGEILKGKLSTIIGEKTYAFTAKNDGKLYIKFDSKYSLGHYSSRYEFEVKTGFEDGMIQDTTTFEYNDFQEVSYSIEKNKIYKSTAMGMSDPDDWYVLENIDSAKEHYLHLVNLGANNDSGSRSINCEILDEKGKIKKIILSTISKENTYTFQPIQDGKVYLHFSTEYIGAVRRDMRYSFDVK